MTYPDWDADHHPDVVWPPADADTLVVLKVAEDSRPGWLRFTWHEGETFVQGDKMEQEVPPDLDLTDRDAVLAWISRCAYGYVWKSWDFGVPPSTEVG